MIRKKIGAIMVLYKPNLDQTIPAIESLAKQVDEICLIDNTPRQNISDNFIRISNAHYISLNDNSGIATAQNIGIKYFSDKKYDFILFSDQDSIAQEDVVVKLLQGFEFLKKQCVEIAAVGTRPINKNTGKPYPAKSKEIGCPKELLGSNSTINITECYSIISSISLIHIEAFHLVGGFDESLFIDGVDHEWCWRAWHLHKLRSFIIENAPINHMLGEGDRNIGNKNISIASSMRVYYQFRNYIWLSKRDYTPKYWIKTNRKKYIIKAA